MRHGHPGSGAHAVGEGVVGALHDPRSVAIIGASDNPEKVGGRPVRFLKEFGFRGEVYPVNGERTRVQDLPAFATVRDLPRVPDVAVIAVPGPDAVAAVTDCAQAGVPACVILSSGFSETRSNDGVAMQHAMVEAARSAGMRLVGPNSQGLVNFGTGAVLAFSSMFVAVPPVDGPVGIVSQSGGMAAIAYALLRRRGIGVRYVHGTGNDCDLDASDLLSAVLDDPHIRVALVYIEGIRDAARFAEAASKALDRGVPIVALAGGRSATGARAASSHTGSLASDGAVLDAFLRRLGVRPVATMSELAQAVDIYLQDSRWQGDRLGVVTNSGGISVLSADHAHALEMPMAEFDDGVRRKLKAVLPPFATVQNPMDITGALLQDNSLFARTLDCIDRESGADAYLLSVPVPPGAGYDVDGFATAIDRFARRTALPVATISHLDELSKIYRSRGVAVYPDEADAIRALSGFVNHHAVIQSAKSLPRVTSFREPHAPTRTLNEFDSLALLGPAITVTRHELVKSVEECADARAQLGGGTLVVKACSADAPHKSELGLVRLNCTSLEDVESAATEMIERMQSLGLVDEGILLQQQVTSSFEAMVGAHLDDVLGPVVVVGHGGKYVEAEPDFRVLIPPFDADTAMAEITRLRCAPRLKGIRGKSSLDPTAWAELAVLVGDLMLAPDSRIESLDLNPVLLVPNGPVTAAVVVDALAVLGVPSWPSMLPGDGRTVSP